VRSFLTGIVVSSCGPPGTRYGLANHGLMAIRARQITWTSSSFYLTISTGPISPDRLHIRPAKSVRRGYHREHPNKSGLPKGCEHLSMNIEIWSIRLALLQHSAVHAVVLMLGVALDFQIAPVESTV
ncbi:MAG TPA: hypothetical protein VNS88_07780, partial [Nitrospiraceae bacterium]|nr:hypothetical protein [Nitrospiraceae bacterium]